MIFVSFVIEGYVTCASNYPVIDLLLRFAQRYTYEGYAILRQVTNHVSQVCFRCLNNFKQQYH